MNPEQVGIWLAIAATIGGAGLSFGLLKGRVDEQERRIETLERRADHTDEALKAVIRMEEQIKQIIDAVNNLVNKSSRRQNP